MALILVAFSCGSHVFCFYCENVYRLTLEDCEYSKIIIILIISYSSILELINRTNITLGAGGKVTPRCIEGIGGGGGTSQACNVKQIFAENSHRTQTGYSTLDIGP